MLTAIHKRLADKAALDGNSSAQFRSAAQRHANVTWFFVIATAVVWYFLSWKWASIPAAIAIFFALQSISATWIANELEYRETKMERRPRAQIDATNLEGGRPDTVDTAEDVIGMFGEILATAAPAPGCVADSDELPYSKDRIKQSIISVLQNTSDQRLCEQLKFAYVSLADWQENVGGQHLGLDLRRINQDAPPEQISAAICAMSADVQGWRPIIRAEQQQLITELKQIGYWP